MSEPSILRRVVLSMVLAAAGCARAPHPSEPKARGAAPITQTARPPAPLAPIPDTAAGRQLAAWLEAFNSGDRQALIAYHQRHFPYEVASRDVKGIEREHGLRRGTGGFETRRLDESESHRLVVVLQERDGPQYARVTLEVAPQAPHAVTRFVIGPIRTPRELLSPVEQKARALDAETRRAALESIALQLEAHYVFPETAARVREALEKKQARGAYEALTDAIDFAHVLSRDLVRFTRDKHLGLIFGPMPPETKFEGAAPPWVARFNYGFGAIERLSGNVAHVVIQGLPPLFDEQLKAIAERMSEIADADAAILDLRDNGGGHPLTVTRVASYFFGEQPVHLNSMYRRDTDHTEEHWTERELSGTRFGSDKPVFVLTSPRTFSAGEGLAFALQAQDRALVVGEGTGGGAHPVQAYPVTGGFVLHVPWGRAIDPLTGINWEGVGVVPDVFAPEEEALETAHRLALEKLGRR